MEHGIVEKVGLLSHKDHPMADAAVDRRLHAFPGRSCGVELLDRLLEVRRLLGHIQWHPTFGRGTAPAGHNDCDGHIDRLMRVWIAHWLADNVSRARAMASPISR